MKKTIFAATACAAICLCGCGNPESVTITVTNPLDFNRAGEMVEMLMRMRKSRIGNNNRNQPS